jgi:hypothetical protein
VTLRLTLLFATVATVLSLALPGAARAAKPEDVVRVEAAVVELAKAKRGVASQVSSRKAAAERALAACKRSGPGWRRIHAVRDGSQRAAYARGATILWKDLREVALDGAALQVYTPFFDRFLARFDHPLADPVLQAGVDANRRRIAYNQQAYSFGSCATFEALLRKVREYKVGGADGVAGDYRAGRVYNIFVRYVPKRQRVATRAHWGSQYDSTLLAARDELKALGGDEGYASYFAFAHSLRG